jgi:hypothetical protein
VDPKYSVLPTETVITHYEAIEIEAPTANDAIVVAEAMAVNGTLGDGKGKSDWTAEAYPV